MKKRGAISLSINFLVIIIISLVIFGGGIALLYKLVSGAEEQKANLDAQTQAQLDRLLSQEGKKVAFPKTSATLYAGDSAVFGVGILNIEEKTFGDNFTVKVDLSTALDKSSNDISSKVSTSDWLLYSQGPYNIPENQYQSIPIGVNVPKGASPGTYIFKVTVSDSYGSTYDNVKKFTVTVK